MNILLSQRAAEALAAAPLPVQKAFIKQFDESEDLWQARVNQDWRFYFEIEGDTCRVTNRIPHPE